MTIVPLELIEDILRRLPVKSLKRFRCVAKSWCFLIDSNDFVKSHLRHSLLTNSNRSLILGGLTLCSINLDSIGKVNAVKPPFYYKSVDGISNACNGLVLVMSEPLVLWNPFSADYKVVRGNSGELSPAPAAESISKTRYGFAYDSVNDDYKVVKVVEFRSSATRVWLGSRTEIYSLKSNTWRRIEAFPYPLPFLKGNWRVHVNGALHTLVEEFGTSYVGKLMAFSVESEKHYEVAMPESGRTRGFYVSLDVIGSCLSIVCGGKSRVNVFEMREYGVGESWTKLLSISPPWIEPGDFVKPLVYSRDGGKVLLNCDDKRLVWYDLKKKSVEEVTVEGMPFVFYAEPCVESLVAVDESKEVRKLGQVKKKGNKIRNKRDAFLSEGFKLVL